METLYTTNSIEETRSVGRKLAQQMMPGKIFCLTGDLGSGKTTFTQGILEGLGASGPYSSPTFVIMKQYDLPFPKNGIERVYHVDAYRVDNKDFKTLGFSEWCEDAKGVVILEWPERVTELLPKEKIEITFKNVSENEREIIINKTT